MDTMLRVVAGTLSNNLAMIGNISFHSVKPLFNLRERLLFIDSVAKKVPFSYQGCPSGVIEELFNHHSCQLERFATDAFVFTLPKENVKIPYVSIIYCLFFQTITFDIHRSPPLVLVINIIFLKSNKTRWIGDEAIWLNEYFLFLFMIVQENEYIYVVFIEVQFLFTDQFQMVSHPLV